MIRQEVILTLSRSVLFNLGDAHLDVEDGQFYFERVKLAEKSFQFDLKRGLKRKVRKGVHLDFPLQNTRRLSKNWNIHVKIGQKQKITVVGSINLFLVGYSRQFEGKSRWTCSLRRLTQKGVQFDVKFACLCRIEWLYWPDDGHVIALFVPPPIHLSWRGNAWLSVRGLRRLRKP